MLRCGPGSVHCGEAGGAVDDAVGEKSGGGGGEPGGVFGVAACLCFFSTELSSDFCALSLPEAFGGPLSPLLRLEFDQLLGKISLGGTRARLLLSISEDPVSSSAVCWLHTG